MRSDLRIRSSAGGRERDVASLGVAEVNSSCRALTPPDRSSILPIVAAWKTPSHPHSGVVMQYRKSGPRGRLLVAAVALSLALSACASAGSDSRSQSSEPVDGGVFRLATVAEPAGL